MPLFKHSTIVLDASCVITLYASDHMADILQAVPSDVTVAAYVAQKEALYVRGKADRQGKRQKVPIYLHPLIEQNLLTLVDEESEAEANLHINLATQIRGRGEVTTAAIAINRCWGMVVDDKRARNLFHRVAPHIQLLHTLDLVRYWTEQMTFTPNQITNILQHIHARASFHPNALDPNYN